MNFLVKETLFLLDYEDNIKETLFVSTDKRTPGYAYEINIKDYNTGYSDLSFRMPCDIVNEEGETIKNPKLALLVPLSKVRYNRTIRYMGKESISVPAPDGSTKIFPEENGNRLLEDYTMDYIVQPLDKARQGLGISLTYTAIDFPRFNLSKKKVGLTFDNQTITTQELSLYKNEPLSTPGSIQYIPWTKEMSVAYLRKQTVKTVAGLSSIQSSVGDYVYVTENGGLYQKLKDGTWTIVDEDSLVEWSPNAQSQSYPLDSAAVKKLVNETVFSYGILATVYYWPVIEDGRFEGVWYEKGGFITLSLYNTYEGSDWEGSDYLEGITHKWGHLEPIEHYLCPNNACNYLRYILKDTNWKVEGDKDLFIPNTQSQPWFNKGQKPSTAKEKQYYITYEALEDNKYNIEVFRYENNKWVDKTGTTFEQIVNTDINDKDFGMLYDIDIEQVEVPRSAEASVGTNVLTDARYSLSVSNANCYNAITSAAKLFDLYPVFNCLKKTASLKLNVGKDYGLSYRYKSNLKSSNVKADGEKVITKLYVTGGSDAQGEQNITIGEANRTIVGKVTELSTAATASEYLKPTITSQMEELEENIYNHINGVTITKGINMSNYKFKFTFADNLYSADTNRSNTVTRLVEFSSGKSIARVYNPTGSDKCYYIYIRHTKDDDWKNEANQLYKFDEANMTLRRNLTEYVISGIGTIQTITSNQSDNDKIIDNIKYCPPLDSRAKKDGRTYVGNIINAETSDGKYVLNNISQNESFVLSGPDRVYKVPQGETQTYNYGVGNYYYIEDTNTYRYCAIQYSDSGSAYSKINNIAVVGYVFVELGAPTKNLVIQVNGTNSNVFDLNNKKLTLQDWMVNDFALRVIYDGTTLKADEQFNPNADEYLVCRSPYGTSYIYNFKYLYDNGWMTKEDILAIYAKNKELNDINADFYDRYTKDLVNIQAAYNDAVNNYDIYASKADAQLEALMSQYWINPNKASEGHFSAFPGFPKDVPEANWDADKKKYYLDITYDEPQDNGTTISKKVKTVYFDVFGSQSCDKYPFYKDNKITNKNPHTEGQYHVVANALGWENNYKNKLTINSEITGYTSEQDPSNTASSYNKFVSQMKEYYYRAEEADKQMVEAEDRLNDLMDRYKEWENSVAAIEKYLQENYGEYIIEGSYSNTEQPYSNLLIKEGLEASDKYATPDITYTIGVVDSSGLIEYRAPQKLICNSLIKRLHSVGQIAPHVGDYVAIQDEPMGMFGVPGLITQISRRIDDPYQNTITIDTSYTDADELVGNIITATNTVLSNKDIYGRAAIINNKGELSSTSVNGALSTGTDSISIVSASGKVTVDDNGLTCVNPHYKNEVMRYNGTGILGSINGGATWRELITQNGINANYINAGTINASKVSITDGAHDITVMNADGLIVKSRGNKPYVLGSLEPDTVGIKKAFDNVSVFVGRDAEGNGIGYFNGYINASKGGNIAGWTLLSDKLYATSDTNKYVALSSTGNYALWAGNSDPSKANFRLSHDGTLYSATVNSRFEITDGKIATEVKDRKDADSGLSSRIEQTVSSITLGVQDNTTSGQIKLSITKEGGGTANSTATISSITLTADKVTLNGGTNQIGGWIIKDDYLGNLAGTQNSSAASENYFLSQGGKYAYCSMNSGQHYYYLFFKDKFAVDTEGRLYCKNATITGSISGSTISGSSFTGGSLSIMSDYGGLKVSDTGTQVQLYGTIGGYSGSTNNWIISSASDATYGGTTYYWDTKSNNVEIESNAHAIVCGPSGVHLGPHTSTSDCKIDIYKSGIRITGKIDVYEGSTKKGTGVNVDKFECENPDGTPWLKIVNGIIVDYGTK
jgi:hypothetical protein